MIISYNNKFPSGILEIVEPQTNSEGRLHCIFQTNFMDDLVEMNGKAILYSKTHVGIYQL